jgi:hypothetical protein
MTHLCVIRRQKGCHGVSRRPVRSRVRKARSLIGGEVEVGKTLLHDDVIERFGFDGHGRLTGQGSGARCGN